MKSVVRAVKNYNKEIKVVTAGYADYKRMDSSLDYLSIPTIAAESGADFAMIDTYIKDKKGLFEFLNIDQLLDFKEKAYQLKLKIALAGNLKSDVIPKIRMINPDIIGVRSVVCDGYDRNQGSIRLNLIENLISNLYK